MTEQDWCSKQITKLRNEDSRVPTLNEIKNHFSGITQDEAIRIANNVQLTPVFDCLNDSNTEQVDLACEVLTLCMSNLTLGDSTKRYSTYLERALNHPYSVVKLTALKEIERNLTDEDILLDISRRSILIHAVIKCIGDNDLGVAKKAADIIIEIGISPNGIQQLLTVESMQVFHDVMATNEVVRLRVHEVFIDMAQTSEQCMQLLNGAGLLSEILQGIENNDVLLKMNVIELLAKLVTTKHGYEYLETQGVIQNLLNHFEDDGDPLTRQLCEPGLLKFFGHMVHWRPSQTLSKYPKIINRLFENIQGDDWTLVGVSLDTLGYIAKTNDGKYSLNFIGHRMLTILKTISDRMTSFTTEIRIRALDCLENCFRIPELDSRITNLLKKWYLAMGEDPMSWIFKMAQNPFNELRLATLGLLSALAAHHWGQECFLNTAGFIEFLLDRRSETFKECKQAKYEIVGVLANSSVFDHSTQTRLQAFVKEGPFYIQAVTDVAIEGD